MVPVPRCDITLYCPHPTSRAIVLLLIVETMVVQRRHGFFLLLLLLNAICATLSFHPKSIGHAWHRINPRVLSLSQKSNEAIRLNKVFKATFSRREADKIIQEGRVSVNGKVCFGCMVVPNQDVVALDGKVVQGWETMNACDQQAGESIVANLEYVKYWKPKGVVCTTDQRIKGNIVDEITHRSGYRPKHRVYPVGRLDKDSSGLILLTSDGRLPNASLRREQKQPKVYQVNVDRPLLWSDLELLRSGVVITTVAQRDGTAKALTAKTKPCLIEQIGQTSCIITLLEGRNRQIRKMMEAVGCTVLDLHRIEFGEIKLSSLKHEGDWARLNSEEMAWIETLLQNVE